MPNKDIPGYSYGAAEAPNSPVSPEELSDLQTSAGFTDEDCRFLRLAGEVLDGQTTQIVEHWRAGIIAGIPHLARHSRTPEGDPLPEYLAMSNLRFEQWILDTCLRPYDRDWPRYQQEIALRHTSTRKNQVDGVRSRTTRRPQEQVRRFGINTRTECHGNTRSGRRPDGDNLISVWTWPLTNPATRMCRLWKTRP